MDSILYWNDVALETNRVSHTNGKEEQTGPTLSARALAMVHLAMYDAFAGADKVGPSSSNLSPYLTNPAIPAPPPGTSTDTAVAAAAYWTLRQLFPGQRAFLDLIYDANYSPVGLPAAGVQDGHDYGKLVAERILGVRAGDPGAGSVGYTPQDGRGKHRPDPDNPAQGFHGPFYGAAPLFATTTRYMLDKPPKVETGNGDYLRALRQVRDKGVAPELMGLVLPASRRRTENETVIGLYWGYDGAVGLGTPPRLYNQIIREVATNIPNPNNGGAVNTPAQNARLFALVNAAMGDASILAWEQKYRYEYWRPVVGIREHDPSMGPLGIPGDVLNDDCDIGWLPLGAPSTNTTRKNFTPPFPAYPSGHATFGAAAFHVTRRFYGVVADDTDPDSLFAGLSFVSEELDGVSQDNKGAVRPKHVREFPDGLWQMIIENGLARVYLGVHWVFDAFAVKNNGKLDVSQNIGGVPLGLNIANDVYDSGMTAQGAAPASAAETMMTGAMEPEAEVSLSAVAPRLPWPLG